MSIRNDGPATAAELEALRHDGFFVRRHFFSYEDLDEMVALADRAVAYHNQFPPHLDDRYKKISLKDGVTYVNQLGDDSDAAAGMLRFALQPRIATLARSVAGPEAAHYCYQLIYKHPHFPTALPWHQDQAELHTTFNVLWVALTDMTLENGCLALVPGAGREAHLPYHPVPEGHSCWPMDDPGRPLELPRGSAVVTSCWAVHRSGGNATDAMRKAVLFAFMPHGRVADGKPVPLIDYPMVREEAMV